MRVGIESDRYRAWLMRLPKQLDTTRSSFPGHAVGQAFILDVDGNFISKLCPNKMCVYLISQLTVPVALINERLSENLEPNDFHFMRYVRCPDTGVDCYGYGEVTLKVQVVPRVK